MTGPLRLITPADLVCLNDFEAAHPVKIDLVYAQSGHPDNMFRRAIYAPAARMWGHKDLAAIILRAASLCHAETGLIFELKDCLRPVEAQAAIVDTPIVRANPQWLEEPRLFSPPGKGGHPRGMAVDVILVTENGDAVDMGTRFDYMTPDKAHNPAARAFTDFSKDASYNALILKNRALLEDSLLTAAREAGKPLLPLPQEWWDFRFPADYSNLYAPVEDKTLPPHMRMMAD